MFRLLSQSVSTLVRPLSTALRHAWVFWAPGQNGCTLCSSAFVFQPCNLDKSPRNSHWCVMLTNPATVQPALCAAYVIPKDTAPLYACTPVALLSPFFLFDLFPAERARPRTPNATERHGTPRNATITQICSS